MTRSARRETIQHRLGCFGYFGFGGGWEMARRRRRVVTSGGQPVGTSGYCEVCRLRKGCIERHRERAREVFPDAMELLDTIYQELEDFSIDAVFHEWKRRTKSTTVPPDVALHFGNMEDGERVARELDPHNRDRGTLTWPLEVLEPLQEATDDA